MSWRLFLIRHGMTEGNREKRYIGKTDEGVCDEGRRMLERRKAAGEYPEADLVFVSPMRRCLETAEVLYPGQEPVGVEEFRECDFGLFEGKNYRELTGNVHYQAWIDSGGTLPFPEGESRGAFQDRCCAGFVRMAGICAEWERAEEKKGTERRELRATCVVHGGTIMALLERFGTEGGDYYSYQCGSGQGYRCVAGGSPEEIGKGEIELSCIQPLVFSQDLS